LRNFVKNFDDLIVFMKLNSYLFFIFSQISGLVNRQVFVPKNIL
jgi:hypothetical protein